MNKEDFLFTEYYNNNGEKRPLVIRKNSIDYITKHENSGKALIGLTGSDGLTLLDVDYNDLLIELFNQ